jgi:hypothetical protein
METGIDKLLNELLASTSAAISDEIHAQTPISCVSDEFEDVLAESWFSSSE